jgi:hypothetical protein
MNLNEESCHKTRIEYDQKVMKGGLLNKYGSSSLLNWAKEELDGQGARRVIAEVKQRSHWSVIG